MFFKKCYNNISAEETKQMMNKNPDIMILDVRERGEYSQGHIKESKNIPLGSLGFAEDSLPKDKQTPLVTYCLSGARAQSACRVLGNLGYTNIYCLGGLGDWPYGFER